MTSRNFLPPRRQERQERLISPTLACFASLRESSFSDSRRQNSTTIQICLASFSMIEMHLDPAPAIDHFSFDSVSVLANHKTGESDDGLFIGEKCIFARPLAGKFH